MAQAESKVTIVAAKNEDKTVKLADAYRDFEGDVNDLLYMATLAVQTVEDLLRQPRPQKDNILCTDERRNVVQFAVNHLQTMANKFKDDYYRNWPE